MTGNRVTISTGPGKTKQSFKDECDINFIMNKWQRTGEIPANMVGTMKPHYGDYSDGNDYMEACNQVLEAKAAFQSLPAFLRDRFANEPANLLRFLSLPENQEEAIKLGLAEKPEENPPEKPAETPPTPTPAASAATPTPSPIEGGE